MSRVREACETELPLGVIFEILHPGRRLSRRPTAVGADRRDHVAACREQGEDDLSARLEGGSVVRDRTDVRDVLAATEPAGFDRVAELSERVPAYWLELGSDIDQIPDAVKALAAEVSR